MKKDDQNLLICTQEEYEILKSVLGPIGITVRFTEWSREKISVQVINEYRDFCMLCQDRIGQEIKKLAEDQLKREKMIIFNDR